MKRKIALAFLAATAMTPVAALAADPPGGATASSEVSGVVVTAQRREENQTAVPIAITAHTGQQLQNSGITSIMDLGLITPGLYYAQQGNSAEPVIRGVGTSITTPGADANVALYIDDVYQPNQTANNFNFNDVQDIQVLKGPQGTLFGRNSTGGALTVKTFDPANTPQGNFSFGYGSFNEFKANAYGSVPFTDRLAANAAVFYVHDDGYIHNLFTGNNIGQNKAWGGRGKIRWNATDNLTFILGLNYSHVYNNAPYSKAVLNGNTNQARALFLAGTPLPTGIYDTALTVDPGIETENIGVSLHAKLQLELGTISYVGALQRINNKLISDIDNVQLFISGANIIDNEVTISNELTFASRQFGRFNMIGGVYYYQDFSHYHLYATAGTRPPPNFTLVEQKAEVPTHSIALFAEGNFDITDQLRLIFGGRYTSEIKGSEMQTNGGPLSFSVKNHYSTFNPRVILQYRPDQQTNLYFSYSSGSKSGNYNVGSTVPVRPEQIDAFELGFKRSTGAIRFDIAGYYYKYKDLQVQAVTNSNGVISTVLQNASNATAYGIDADIVARLNENWRVTAGAAWFHGVYDNFPNAITEVPIFLCATANGATVTDPSHACSGAGMTFSNGNAQGLGSATGKAMVRAPTFTINGQIDYTHPLPVGRLEANLTVSYNNGFWWDTVNSIKEPGYTIVNAQASWVSEDSRYRVTVWGANLAAQKYHVWVNPTTAGNGAVIGRPLTAGVTLAVKLM